jgi:predicted DNA-binding transcriptional regulator AlpA
MIRTPTASLIDERAAAEYIGMTTSALRVWRAQTSPRSRTVGPPFVRIGRTIRYRVTDLDAWIAAHLVDPAGQSSAV